MSDIKYLFGDVTKPGEKGPKIIMHICNDVGAWGRGFVLAVTKRWKEPEEVYRQISSRGDLELGSVQCIEVGNKISVVNMIAQKRIRNDTRDKPPIRYDALRDCLKAVAILAEEKDATVHAPRIGTGLAGGDWEIIEDIIQEELCNNGIKVFIYNLP